jgi:hypothetical protein
VLAVQHLGESVLREIEEFAVSPLFSTVEKRGIVMRRILDWEREEPLRVGYWRLSADPNVMDAAEVRQWQTLVRTYLRRLSDEQLRAKVAEAPDILVPAVLASQSHLALIMSDRLFFGLYLKRMLQALSFPDLLGLVLEAGELNVDTRTYFLKEKPDIRLAAYAPPIRPTPLPTIDAYVGDAIRHNVILYPTEIERRAVVSYLSDVGITTPRQFVALATDSPVLAKMSQRLRSARQPGAAYDIWLRIRYALKLPLSDAELNHYHRSYTVFVEWERVRYRTRVLGGRVSLQSATRSPGEFANTDRSR